MVKLKKKVNKSATFRDIKDIAEIRYKESWQPDLQKEAFFDGAKAIFELLRSSKTQ